MAIVHVIMVGADSLPDPLNIALEVTAFSGNNHKIYLKDPTTNLIPNGDGQGTTDWINPTSGLAQFWVVELPV